MSKDPAVLIYVNNWLSSTAGMDADCRGWYINLLLHNYDKGFLSGDIEELAVLANVKHSQFERFKQVFKQVLKHKFKENEDGSLINPKTEIVLRGREEFKEKRSEAGKKSYLSKFLAKHFPKQFRNNKLKTYVLNNIDLNIDLKNEQVLKQVFEQMFELYINVNVNKDIIIDNNTDSSYRQFSHLSISQEEFDKLKESGYLQEQIDSILDSIENYKANKKYSSLYLTAKKWLSKEHGVPLIKSANADMRDETEEERFHREWKAKNKTIPMH